MLNTQKSAYSAALVAALLVGCEDNHENADLQAGVTTTVDTSKEMLSLDQFTLPKIDKITKYSIDELRSKEFTEHPYYLLLELEFTGRNLQTPQELFSRQAHALLDFSSIQGKEFTEDLYKAAENLFPLGADFSQLRNLYDLMEKQNPGFWTDREYALQFIKSTFNGSVKLEPVVVDEHVEIRFTYQVRPWEHPVDVNYYYLYLDMTASIENPDLPSSETQGLTKTARKDEIQVRPYPGVVWRTSQVFDAPLPKKGEVLDVTVSMSSESITNSTDFSQSNEKEPLVKRIRLIRGGNLRNKQGEELLILEDPQIRKSFQALESAYTKAADWAHWYGKDTFSRETRRLEAMWLGKKVPDLVLQSINDLKNPWKPTPSQNQFGGPALIEFFQMSCGPCIQAMPELAELSKNTPALKIIAICNPKNAEGIEKLQSTPYLAVPTSQTWKQFDIHEFPSKMLIDKKGYVRWIGSGSNSVPGNSLIQSLLTK